MYIYSNAFKKNSHILRNIQWRKWTKYVTSSTDILSMCLWSPQSIIINNEWSWSIKSCDVGRCLSPQTHASVVQRQTQLSVHRDERAGRVISPVDQVFTPSNIIWTWKCLNVNHHGTRGEQNLGVGMPGGEAGVRTVQTHHLRGRGKSVAGGPDLTARRDAQRHSTVLLHRGEMEGVWADSAE